VYQDDEERPLIPNHYKFGRRQLRIWLRCWRWTTSLPLLEAQSLAEILPVRRRLPEMLSANDYAYMVWQEWKEGFARFIENRIKARLGLPENQGGKEQPFSRVTFYAGGANFIAALDKAEPALITDIERLFERMFQGYGP
jgi:hypothetical protein